MVYWPTVKFVLSNYTEVYLTPEKYFIYNEREKCRTILFAPDPDGTITRLGVSLLQEYNVRTRTYVADLDHEN